MAPFDGSDLSAEDIASLGHAPPDQFKEVLARLAGGLAIVSFWDQGRPHGLLVSSITGLSVDPPRFLFCVRKEASSHDALLSADRCGVTILSHHDQAEAQSFVQPELKASRFTGDSWRLAEPSPPLFHGGLSSTDCLISTKIDAGSHTILIVTAQNVTVKEGEPLLSFNRNLRSLSSMG